MNYFDHQPALSSNYQPQNNRARLWLVQLYMAFMGIVNPLMSVASGLQLSNSFLAVIE